MVSGAGNSLLYTFMLIRIHETNYSRNKIGRAPANLYQGEEEGGRIWRNKRSRRVGSGLSGECDFLLFIFIHRRYHFI